MDLAAHDRAEPRDEVAADAPAADDEPEHLALRLGDAMAGSKTNRNEVIT